MAAVEQETYGNKLAPYVRGLLWAKGYGILRQWACLRIEKLLEQLALCAETSREISKEKHKQ